MHQKSNWSKKSPQVSLFSLHPYCLECSSTLSRINSHGKERRQQQESLPEKQNSWWMTSIRLVYSVREFFSLVARVTFILFWILLLFVDIFSRLPNEISKLQICWLNWFWKVRIHQISIISQQSTNYGYVSDVVLYSLKSLLDWS